MLGLPDAITACLFDMDGVITQTARVHDAAWKEMFDEFLRSWSAAHDQPFVPFDPVNDYDEYVDGKPRLEGTASFLESRGIKLPARRRERQAGRPHHLGPEQQEERPRPRGARARRGEGLRGLGQRYVDAVRASRPQDGDRVVKRQHRGRAQGGAAWRTCSTSASTHQVAEERHLHGKPAPDTFLEAAQDARRRRRRTLPSSRTRSPGSPRDGRDISGSSWAWTGSARPTSCARTAPTWW